MSHSYVEPVQCQLNAWIAFLIPAVNCWAITFVRARTILGLHTKRKAPTKRQRLFSFSLIAY